MVPFKWKELMAWEINLKIQITVPAWVFAIKSILSNCES